MGLEAGTRPRVAIIASVLGVPSEVWIERQCLSFTRIEPVMIGWAMHKDWVASGQIETHIVQGNFGSPPTLWRRILRRLGMAHGLSISKAQQGNLRAAIRDAKVDAVLCHFAWTGMVVEQALPKTVPMILHVHGRDVSASMKLPSYRRRLQILFHRAAALIVVGNHQLIRLSSFELPTRVQVIPCGAPLELFAASPMPDQGSDGPLRFISVGRMSVEKGMMESIQAFELIAEQFPRTELVLVGFGPDFDAIAAAAAASPFAARIRLTGRLPSEAIARELSEAHVYLQHSREVGGWVEGFGVTLTEAGAAGLPLLASASGGLVDQIKEGENGFLFPEGDVSAQAALMRRLAEDPVLRMRLGSGARRLAARFDTRLMAAELEEEILAVIGEHVP